MNLNKINKELSANTLSHYRIVSKTGAGGTKRTEVKANNKGVNKMARPSKLAHVVYMTKRFEEMIDWYQKVFEAKVVYQNPVFAFLTYDDEHHRFAFANMSTLSPTSVGDEGPAKVGVNHVGYTYANMGELLETYARLKQLGIKPYWPVHHGVTLSIYYQDPDGNRMEFQVDCCANSEEAHALMHSDACR